MAFALAVGFAAAPDATLDYAFTAAWFSWDPIGTLPSARGREPPRPRTWPPAFTLAFASTALAFAVAATLRQTLSAGRRPQAAARRRPLALAFGLAATVLAVAVAFTATSWGTDQTRGSTRAKQNQRVKTSSRSKKDHHHNKPTSDFHGVRLHLRLGFRCGLHRQQCGEPCQGTKAHIASLAWLPGKWRFFESHLRALQATLQGASRNFIVCKLVAQPPPQIAPGTFSRSYSRVGEFQHEGPSNRRGRELPRSWSHKNMSVSGDQVPLRPVYGTLLDGTAPHHPCRTLAATAFAFVATALAFAAKAFALRHSAQSLHRAFRHLLSVIVNPLSESWSF